MAFLKSTQFRGFLKIDIFQWLFVKLLIKNKWTQTEATYVWSILYLQQTVPHTCNKEIESTEVT